MLKVFPSDTVTCSPILKNPVMFSNEITPVSPLNDFIVAVALLILPVTVAPATGFALILPIIKW